MGPKRHQKRDQNDIEILIDFWTDFGPILEAQEDPAPRFKTGGAECAGPG